MLTTPQQVQAGENVKQSIGSLFAGMYTNATMVSASLSLGYFQSLTARSTRPRT